MIGSDELGGIDGIEVGRALTFVVPGILTGSEGEDDGRMRDEGEDREPFGGQSDDWFEWGIVDGILELEDPIDVIGEVEEDERWTMVVIDELDGADETRWHGSLRTRVEIESTEGRI